CPHCRARVKGDLPDAATGTPFGPRLHALALYLKTCQAVSFARLAGMFAEVFGVKVSQGTLANMLKRSHRSFEAARQETINELRQADVVASDGEAEKKMIR
ncbi:MAG: transposase, partial [Gammaproteobacteria bacterium]|nr:transposase [Gammaproteobacteria bacterium]